MGWEGWLTSLLTIAVLLTLIKTSIKPHMVMMSALALLSVLGILDASEALAGFANPGLITVSAMFVVAAGIQHSGGIELLVNKLLGQPQTLKSALLRVFLPVVPLSAFLNNTPVVATMIPALISWSKKTDIPPSKLLIPLSYAAILGGTLTLIGTSTNLVVNGQYQSLTGTAGFGLFDITLVGLPVALLGLVAMYFIAPALLPNRQEQNPFSNLREFTLEVCVSPAGPLVGKSIKQAGLRDLKQVYLVEIERGHTVLSAVSSDEILYGGDRLVFTGESQSITELMRIHGLEAPAQLEKSSLEDPHAGRVLVEVVVSTHCDAIGSDIRDAQFRNRYGAVVLAVARNGERLTSNLGNIKLQAGDTLLLEARPAFVSRQQYNKDFLLVNNIEQDIPNHTKASLAWLILGTAVAAAALGLTSMLNAALLAAGGMLASRCLSIKQAEKSLDLGIYLTIAASFALGSALQKTGASEYLAHAIVDFSAGDALLLLILTYLCVSIMTEMITNNAAAILILPVILDITTQANLNPEPYIFAIMMAVSASFATPLGYQTNLMVMGPGNYRFSDFLRIGLPMNLFIGIATITLLASFWSLSLSTP
ncbi:potassium transporter peripheral membrane component [Marinomonas aquimarina]|uniref:Potassium transporter peripheral membrane component n=1 Tax=Marinomonas aquimarina TaxID=295068 RepID=A0A1A8TJT7_9GAMM|nr:SLC13 family permease [Marinomonas aquimarina]SBS33746.1 potassium transporter peripheral membrane component [Marinomonas aquimarina]